ncbi:hypothetical protein [Microvirga sp. 2TAF3]|uniref:hypothetical protein n=1 Tax=Microvirga sp. 2TAF3 TaxID=3233014 RepID=UPI003F9C1920
MLSLAGILLAGASGALSQTDTTGVVPGHAPGLPTPAPSVNTGTAGTNPETTGSTGGGSTAKPPDTMPAGPNAAINAGASGRNTCYPGQSGKPVGSTNPAGMPSQC